MKKIIRIYSIPLLILCLFASGCKKNTFSAEGWQPHVLGPVATGKVTAEAIGDIRNKHFEQTIQPYDVGSGSGTIPFVPALSIKHLGPYINQISDYFQYAEIDTADVTISFVNNFPTTVKAGTTIVLRSSTDTASLSSIVLSHTLSSDIAPNSTYTFNLHVTNTNFPSTTYLYLDNFKADSASNVQFNNQPAKVTFDVNILRISLLAINTNKSYSIQDTSTFQISSDQSGSISDSSVAGTIKIFLTNKLPVNFSSQFIFLDGNKNVLDSLITGNSTALAATTDANGIATSSVESLFQVPVNYSRLHKIKQSQYMVFRIKADTYGAPGSVVFAGRGSGTNFQIVTDMKVQMGSFFK